MRSGEIAKLAGVTVRTLRHYRSVGLLPEPPHSENGYANYSIDHLIRILRIKQLASLGFSLERIGGLLEDMDANEGESSVDPLDELDHQLERHIEQLQQQRRTIALLKNRHLDADIPAQFADLMGMLRETDPAPSWPMAEKEATLIAAHTFDEASIDEMEAILRAIAERGLAHERYLIEQRLIQLTPDASRAECDEIVADGVAFIEQIADCFSKESWERQSTETELLLERIQLEQFNQVQKHVFKRILDEAERIILSRDNRKSH